MEETYQEQACLGGSGYGESKECANSVRSGDYKKLFINLGSRHYITLNDDLRIRITFQMNRDTAESVEKNLYNHLYTEEGSKKSNSWLIHNYAEINAYATEDGYLDYNSRPGNLDLVEYQNYRKEYQQTYNNYVLNPSTDNERAIKLALARLNAVREDDAWTVGLTLTNNGYIRELSGNVWEAIPENSEFKNSLGLNKAYGPKDDQGNIIGVEYPLYDKAKENLNLEGIKVELVELLKNGDNENGATQIVRGVTTTKADGSYRFTSYIAGDYVIRFIYGDYENTDNYSSDNPNGVIRSKVTTFADETPMPVNGQYYQSTRANPNTDTHKYWYKDRDYNDVQVGFNDKEVSSTKSTEEFLKRYSDAYDDAYSRLTQMESEVVTEKENFYNDSIQYDYQAVREVETLRHTDPMYAYTSTMELEIEYTRPDITGNRKNSWYEYKVNGVDFGVTPRSTNDVNIDKYVSNVKIYLPDTSKLIDVTFNQDGTFNTNVEQIGSEHIGQKYTQGSTAIDLGLPNSSYPDGYAYVSYNEQLLQRARIEVTYKIKVSNDSQYEKRESPEGSEEDLNVYDRIKYITIGTGENAKRIAVIYYEENTENLTAYEGGQIVYHNRANEEFSEINLKELDSGNRRYNQNARLAGYERITGYTVPENSEIISSRATQIIDYPNAPFDFTRTTYMDELEGKTEPSINKYWVDIQTADFVSSREKYKTSDTARAGENNTELPLLDSYSHKLVATNGENGTEVSPLYKMLKPGEETEDELTLSVVLGSTTAEVTDNPDVDLTKQDYELSNLVELTRIANTAGKMTELEGYGLITDVAPESSEIHKPEELDGDKPKFVPTLGTDKSETIIIATPTGLSFGESMVGSNLWIVLVALIVLAGGLVVIKKFVLVKSDN